MYRLRMKANAMIFTGWLLAVGVARSPAQMPERWCGMEAMQVPEPEPPCTRGACDDAVNRDPWIPNSSSPFFTIRLRFNVFCEDDGSGCLVTSEQVNAQIAVLNAAFVGYRIQFVADQQPAAHPIHSSRYKHFCSVNSPCVCDGDPRESCGSEDQEMKFFYADDPALKLNIYVVETDASDFRGDGYLPWWPSATGNDGGIIIDADFVGGLQCGASGFAPCRTLAHEIGHNLGLWHIYHGVTEVSECGSCFELASCDGSCQDSLCNTVGDRCCDTAATKRWDQCSTPPGGDECPGSGAPWSQEEANYRNYMSNTRDDCWDRFSSQQAGRMRCWTCEKLGGWIVGEDCENNGIPDACEPRGACCNGEGACIIATECSCPGYFFGVGTTCPPGIECAYLGPQLQPPNP